MSVTRNFTVGVDNRIWAHDPTTGKISTDIFGNTHDQTCTITHGGSVPGYRKRIAQGQDATSSLGATFYRTTWGTGSRYHVRVTEDGTTFRVENILSGCFWGVPAPDLNASTASFDRANNMALQAFATKAINAQSEFQATISGGELGETLRGIRHPAKAFRQGLNDYLFDVKKRFKGRRRLSPAAAGRIVSETWLEWSFGWKPLYNDIHSGAEALANYLNYLPERKMIRGKGQDKTQTSLGNADLPMGNNVLHLGRVEVNYLTQVKYYGIVGITDNFGNVDALRHFGVTWNDVIPTIWELTPYSFIVDYFSNIGAILNIFAHGNCGLRWVAQGIKFSAENKRTSVTKTTYQGNPSDPGVKYDEVTFVPGRQGSYFMENLSRSSYGGSLIPSLTFQIPGMGTKWINMSALAFLQSSVAKNIRRNVT